MEDEIVLQEKIMLLEAQYDYLWENFNISTKSSFGKNRKETLSELNKEINYYKKRLDKVRTLNQATATLNMYKNLINEFDNQPNTPDTVFEQEFINKDISRLETFLINFQDHTPNSSLLN